MSTVPIINVANRSSDQVATAPIGNDAALVQPYVAGGAITPNRLVVFGTADDVVVQSSAATGLHVGVYIGDRLAAVGDQVPVAISGIAIAEAGGTVTRGQKLTANASGQVAAAAATNPVIGIALASGVATNLIPILIVQSTYITA